MNPFRSLLLSYSSNVANLLPQTPTKGSSEKLQLITDEHKLLLVPRELCVPRTSVKTKALKNLTSVSQNEKVALLLDYGFWDPEESFVLPSLTLRDSLMFEVHGADAVFNSFETIEI